MSSYRLGLAFSVLAALIVVLCACSNPSNQHARKPNDQRNPNDQQEPRKLPEYDAHFYESAPTFSIDGDISGYSLWATTRAKDPRVLALITQAIREVTWAEMANGADVHPMMMVRFYPPGGPNPPTAMGFYFADTDLADDVLTEAQLDRATIEGRAYVLRGDVKVKGFEDYVVTD
jgi:hypothetical protein